MVCRSERALKFRIYTLLPLREAGRGGEGGAREFVAVCAFWKIRKIIKNFFDTLRSHAVKPTTDNPKDSKELGQAVSRRGPGGGLHHKSSPSSSLIVLRPSS